MRVRSLIVVFFSLVMALANAGPSEVIGKRIVDDLQNLRGNPEATCAAAMDISETTTALDDAQELVKLLQNPVLTKQTIMDLDQRQSKMKEAVDQASPIVGFSHGVLPWFRSWQLWRIHRASLITRLAGIKALDCVLYRLDGSLPPKQHDALSAIRHDAAQIRRLIETILRTDDEIGAIESGRSSTDSSRDHVGVTESVAAEPNLERRLTLVSRQPDESQSWHQSPILSWLISSDMFMIWVVVALVTSAIVLVLACTCARRVVMHQLPTYDQAVRAQASPAPSAPPDYDLDEFQVVKH